MVKTEVLVIGSGAGGATVAATLAEAGLDVLVLEEGPRAKTEDYGKDSSEAMGLLYRNRGMTPLLGPVPVGFVEGRCVGGSTEINSGFWHRTPRETLVRWASGFGLDGASPEELEEHFNWAEQALGVRRWDGPLPPSSQMFSRGVEAMGWSAQLVERTAPNCVQSNHCAHGCPSGAKQGVGQTLIPRAEKAGAVLVSDCRVQMLLKRRGRVTGVLASRTRSDGHRELLAFEADHVFVCAGPTQSPILLRQSGIKFHVGNTLHVHPMLKVTARFADEINAEDSVLPLLQVKEFWPEISMGGAFFTPGHLALMLSDNWPQNRQRMEQRRHMASYYVAVRGSGHGAVRPTRFGKEGTILRYRVSAEELRQLGRGFARLCILLFAAGAEEVYPGVQGMAALRNEGEVAHLLDEPLPGSGVSLTTVHAFSSCPAGERLDRCAVDSWGRVFNFENLYVSDASILPNSPGVNPQGSVMAMARRNALHFLDQRP